MTGDLPPSSSVTGVRFALAARITWLPTAGEPVNRIWSKGREANEAPTPGPPSTTYATSGENISPMRRDRHLAVLGVNLDGLSITRFPAASAVTAGIKER